MNNRRKFLVQTGMAATALLVAKPYKTLAGISGPVSGFGDANAVVFLHTGNTGYERAAKHVTAIQQQYANIVLLHSGNTIPDKQYQLKYDVSPDHHDKSSSNPGAYKIIYKGDFKIGVIHTGSTENNSINQINALAARLKKEQHCKLVVCLSPLGFRSKTGIDDVSLAEQSTHVDIIIGSHEKNYWNQPIIAINQNQQEVIIDNAANSPLDIGKIAIGFDRNGQKNKVAF